MSSPIIEVNQLQVTLQQCVLENIQFTLTRGSFLSIMGPNGAGKTVLIKTLLGLTPPTGGTVKLHCPISAVGYVPQIKTMDPTFPATGVDLVASALKQKWPFFLSAQERREIDQVLNLFGATSFAQKSLQELSGGQRQRLFLARSFLKKPKILLLDEPATGVDSSGEKDLYTLLENFQKEDQGTLVMVTHDLNIALHHSTHVLLIDKRQIAFGRPDEVLTETNMRILFGHALHSHPIGPNFSNISKTSEETRR